MSELVRECQSCHNSFSIPDEQLALLQKLSPTFNEHTFSIPPPTRCPRCRMRRRSQWRGELHLFKRHCDLTGKQIISYFPPGVRSPVYDLNVWYGDSWDPLATGRDFDFSRPFFEQFIDLQKVAPVRGRTAQADQENCEYVNNCNSSRNCYLIAGANHCEDCYYGNYLTHSRNCVDNSFIERCELCYECVDCVECYNLRYSRNCENCRDSYFLHNCRSCRDCFGSVNLIQKEFCFFNEQLTKELYLQKVAALELHKRSSVTRTEAAVEQHRLRYPQRAIIGEHNQNSTGNCIFHTKNCRECFDVVELEQSMYCTWLHRARSCCDVFSFGEGLELCYECVNVGNGAYQNLFCISAPSSSSLLYCDSCISSTHCFGCIGLNRRSYCILNKQYTAQEYLQLVPRIIEHMQKTAEWGEFFPHSVCPLPYNATIAQDYFPLDERKAHELGASWHSFSSDHTAPLIHNEIPDSIDEVHESVLEMVFTCERSGKPFKFIQPELNFYKRQRIPLPTQAFYERHLTRFHKRLPRTLYERHCARCNTLMSSSWAPECSEIVYCPECYRVVVAS